MTADTTCAAADAAAEAGMTNALVLFDTMS